MEIFLTKILPLVLAGTPISLVLINQFSKIFSKSDPSLAKTTAICTNLIGTLTKTSLIARTIFFDKYKGKIRENSDFIKMENTENPGEEKTVEKKELHKDETLKLIAATTYFCKFEKTRQLEETAEIFLKECGINKDQTKNRYKILVKLPPNIEKRLSSIVAIESNTEEIFSFTKGNPYMVLKLCTRTIIEGKRIELTSQLKRKIRKRIEQLNKNGQKVLAFAYKPLPKKRLSTYPEAFANNESVFLGMIGITNPLNANLNEDLEEIKKHGIKTYILTSAKEKKAIAIAKLMKIINPQYFESITGWGLKQLTDQKLAKLISNKAKDFIFTELKKEDKERVVNALKENGENMVIITGKNINKIKEITQSMEKSHVTGKNYAKVYRHAITCKITEFILVLISIAINAPTPLTIALILCLDILINTPLEFALRHDPPPPTSLSTKKSLPQIITNGVLTGLILSGIYIWDIMRNGWTPGENINSLTITFTILCIVQIINAYHFKTSLKSIFKTGIFKNIYLLLSVILTALIIYSMTNLEYIQIRLNLLPLSLEDWSIIAFSCITILLIEEIRKLIIRTFSHDNSDT